MHEQIVEDLPAPKFDAFVDESGDSTSISVSILDGPTVRLWSLTAAKQQTDASATLRLQPEQTAVIGRQQGGAIEYLDPRYQPTQLLPNSSKRVVTSLGKGLDQCVSRGHFLLKGSLNGIFLINGVPRRGGGIRPPKNGTMMLQPERRPMAPGECYFIPSETQVVLRLPNGTVIELRAD